MLFGVSGLLLLLLLLGSPGLDCSSLVEGLSAVCGLAAEAQGLGRVRSHAGLAGDGQYVSGGGAVWATVEAQHLPQASIVEGLRNNCIFEYK